MKRILFLLAAFASMAVACQVEDVNEAQTPAGETFTIEAAIVPSTKTSLTITEDAYKVEWDAEDELSVIALYDNGAEDAGYLFTKGDGNSFSGSVTDPGNISEIYVVYPYDKNHNSFNDNYNNVNGRVTIGSAHNANQTQNGINNTDHINGPLYGYAQVVDGTAEVAMKHISTLFELIVTNNSGDEINVTNVKLANDHGKDMIGTFYVNPVTDYVSASGASYVSSTASLDVTNGTLASGATAKFYITSAPFDLATGDELTVTVTTSDGASAAIVKSIPSDVNFEAGKVNHVKVEIAEVKELEPMSVPGTVQFAEGVDIPEYVTISDYETYSDGSLKVNDVDDNVVVYVGSAVGSVTLTAKYNGAGSTLEILGSADGKDYVHIENVNSETGLTTSAAEWKTSAIISPDYRYFKFNLTEKVTGSNVNLIDITFNEPITDPIISSAVSSLEFAFDDETSGTIQYSILNAEYDDVTVSCDESLNGWFTAEKSADGVISYTVVANEGSERAGNITISVAGGNSIVVKVSQTAKPAEGTVTDVVTVDLMTLGNSYTDFSNLSVTSDAVYAGNVMKNGANIQMRSSSSSQDPSGIITTESGGKVKTISVKWASTTAEGRTLNIYGSNTPYASAGDLYSDSVTPIATIVKGEGKPVSVEIDADYSYIGFRSNSRTMYLEQIEIVWDTVE